MCNQRIEYMTTFWSMLDAALLESSQGKYGLDESISLLIRSKPDEKGGLPVEYERKIVEIGGGRLKNLLICMLKVKIKVQNNKRIGIRSTFPTLTPLKKWKGVSQHYLRL